MDLNLVMDEIGARLGGISELNIYDYPADSISIPAAILTYPERIDYDETAGRGMDVIRNLGLVIVDGRASDRSARDRIAAYVAGTGARSIKAILESGAYASCTDVHVPSAEFDVQRIGGVDYIAAVFTLDVAGQGV